MDPDPEQVEAEFPGWHLFRGIDGLWYATREGAEPVTLRDENTTELAARIRSRERLGA